MSHNKCSVIKTTITSTTQALPILNCQSSENFKNNFTIKTCDLHQNYEHCQQIKVTRTCIRLVDFSCQNWVRYMSEIL